MPNDLTAKRNLLNRRADAPTSQRQKLVSSGFTASIWTISGVVLAACSSTIEDIEEFLGLDDGGDGGGNALHVQRSPVQGARIYFDMDNDGMIDADDITAQDEAFPQGFVTDAAGRAHNIPAVFHGLPFKAVLDGAIDADTGTPLSGEMFSIPDANGAHRLASPITDLLVDADKTPEEVVAELLPNAGSAEIAQILEAINNPRNYLGGDDGVEGFAFFLATETEAMRTPTPTDPAVQAQAALLLADDPTDSNRDTLIVVNADGDDSTTDITVTIGAHDSYVATIQAVSHAGGVGYRFVDADGAPTTISDFSINAQGVISFIGENPTTATLHIEVSNGTPSESEIVRVEVTVADAPSLDELPAGDETATIMENVAGGSGDGTALITGITTSATNPSWEISEANPAGQSAIADKFGIVSGTGDTFNLVLKAGEILNYDAIPGGVLNLHVWAEVGVDKVRSNALALRIQVEEDPDEVAFSGSFTGIVAEDGNLVAQGTFSVENQPENEAVDVSSQGAFGELVLGDNGAWTYTLTNTNADVDGLLTGQTLIDTATISVGGASQNIVIRIDGANEDVRFVDANDVRTAAASVGVELGNPVLADVDIFAGLTLNNANLADIEVDFAETGGNYDLFTITDAGLLTFTGTNADVAGFGSSIPLNLEITAPTLTTATLTFALQVNVINEVDDGRAEYEVTGDVDVGQTLTVSRVQGSDDPDGIVGAVSFQWFRGDEGTPAFTLLGTGDTYIVTQTDIDSSESIGVFVRYTDGSGVTYTHTDGDPATTIAAFASPVSFTGPAIADRTINLDEDTRSGSTVHFAVRAESEDDAGAPVGIANYMLLDANNMPTTTYRGFTIDTTSGDITLTGSLDYEDTTADGTRIILRVRATDMNSPAETATLTLTVNVGDVNDNAPVFDPDQVTTVAIDETLGNGQSVGLSVSATDADGTTANSTVTYSVTGGTGMGIFDVDSSSGVITVLDASMIDFESGTTSYTLIIGASDGLDASGTDDPTFTPDATTTITINISDVNDESPSVLNHADTGSARITSAADNPSSGPGTGMGYTVTVSDADADATSLDVSLTTGDPRFEFVRQTGTNTWELYLIAGQAIAPGELNNQLSFEYIVTDSGVGTTSPTGSFVLTVVDTPVEFTSPSVTTIPLDENNAASLAVATVTATSEDTDGNPVHIASFTLVNDFGGLFSISTSDLGTASAEASITIASANALDFETTESYSLRVLATDTAGQDNTLTLTITVGNVDEPGEATYGIHEPTPGVLALDPAAFVDDPDGVARIISHQWWSNVSGTETAISGANGETFNIPSGDGDSVVYRVDIEYEDGFGATKTVTARTSSVSFDSGFARSGILEETHSGGTLSYSANAEVTTATDTIAVSASTVTPGSPTITYDFASGGNPNNYFAIRANGAITWARETTFDFETLSEAERTLEIVVIATEVENSGTGQTGTGDTARVSIILTIQNEQEGDGTYIVRGNVAAGAELTAEVNDPDGTRSVTYEWYSIDPADNNARTVLGTTQSITLPGAADFDDSLTYHVDIVHIDNLGDRHEETLDASAVVFDIQNTDGNAFPSSIAENTDSLPVVVATLDGDTRSPTYTFVGGDTITTSGVFTISQSGSTAGAITVNAPSDINFETAQEFNDGSRGYTLNVRATFAEDTANNLPEVTGDVVVTIIVTDVNEHAPVFVTNADDNTLSTGTEEIAEDAANGTRVGLFRATDADGSNNDVTYSLDDGGLGVFGIREVTGTNNWEIYVLNNANLDYDPTTTKPTPTRSYAIEITATDRDPDNAMSSAAEAFTINITDVNDNDPVLSATPVWEGTLDFGVPENTVSGVHLFTVSATDADTATTPPPTLTYEIVSIDGVALASIANPIFGIDASDGRVGLAGQLDRETKASHEIVIRAVDEGGRASEPQTFTVTVGDVNDNKPVIPDQVFISTYASGVPESAGSGALFANDGVNPGVLLVNDDDLNQSFTYRIVSIDGVAHGDITNPIFAIQPTSGRFGLIGKLDYETAQSHSVVFEVTDQGGMVSEHKAVVITVLNEDEGDASYAITGTTANNGMLSVALDTNNPDPDGLVAGSETYRWFILNSDDTIPGDGEANGNIDDAGSDDGDDSTLKLPADVGNNVYGVVVTYRDNAGETEMVTVIASAVQFSQNTYTVSFNEATAKPVGDGVADNGLVLVTASLNTNPSEKPKNYKFLDADGDPVSDYLGFTIGTSGIINFKDSVFDLITSPTKSTPSPCEQVTKAAKQG